MATTTQIQQQRIEESYYVYFKRHAIENTSNKPPIEITKDSFFSKGAKLEVYITKVKNVYTDWYDYTIDIQDDQAVEIVSEKPVKIDKAVVYVDTRIETEKADWERFETDTFERAMLYFKSEFDSQGFDNKVSLVLTLDQSIEGQYISEDITEWIFNKFLNSVTLTSLNINTNTLILENSQYNNLRTTINGFDIPVKNLCYFVSDGSITLSHLRLIHLSDNANTVSEITFETRVMNVSNIEVHGLLKLNILGIIDNEANYAASKCVINSVRYYIKDSTDSTLKRNIFKVGNFNSVAINSFTIPKDYPNATFLHIMRCTTVNITNYSNTSMVSSKSGSEIICESITELNVSDVSLSSSVENDGYYFISASNFTEGADITINDCNFVNVGVLDLLSESFGDVRISNCTIVTNKPFNTMGSPIYNFDLTDVNLTCKEFTVDGIVTLGFSNVEASISSDLNIKAEKLVLDDCSFDISGDFIASLEPDASVTASSSRIEDTGIECKNFKIESQEGFNKTLKYAQAKIYASTYIDSGIDKVIVADKTIIEAITYAFKSIKMVSYTEEFYIRAVTLKQEKEAILLQSVFSGKMTFDLENSDDVKNIYLKMLGITSDDEEVNPVSATFIFDGISKTISNKNFHLDAKNAYLDILLKTNDVSPLNVNLSLEGDKSFENCRVFYSGTDTVIYKFEKIDASKLENTEFLEVTALPTKSRFKFKYGVIKE